MRDCEKVRVPVVFLEQRAARLPDYQRAGRIRDMALRSSSDGTAPLPTPLVDPHTSPDAALRPRTCRQGTGGLPTARLLQLRRRHREVLPLRGWDAASRPPAFRRVRRRRRRRLAVDREGAGLTPARGYTPARRGAGWGRFAPGRVATGSPGRVSLCQRASAAASQRHRAHDRPTPQLQMERSAGEPRWTCIPCQGRMPARRPRTKRAYLRLFRLQLA